MATSVETRRAAVAEEHFLERVAAKIREHRQVATYVGGAVALGLLLLVWSMWSGRQAAGRAGEQLQQARGAFESGNVILAASELNRVVENYSGTRAAEEATLLLAQVRMQQGQTPQAVDMLRGFAPGASSAYRAQAYGLLGAAYEFAGRLREAAEAYEQAARAARLPVFEAQYLSEAARVWVGVPDTARALAHYERIVRDFRKAGPSTEAQVRIGELTRGAPGGPR
ncbi:MAG: tetratricopeptide repeat protein [Candidatus Rokuibacteriota bacterium]